MKSSPTREIVLCEDLEDLSGKAAAEFAALANDFARSEGQFNVCLAGGSTPKRLYSLLAREPFEGKISWNVCHFFWGDERCVPPEHPDSNYRMAEAALLSQVPVPESNVHRMQAEKEPSLAAVEYEEALKRHFQLKPGEFPRFHLVFLGLGDDGHTASLFPDNEAVEVKDRLVVSGYVASLKTYRLTLTLPLFNEAANVFFLVSGSSKANAVARVLQPPGEVEPLPAQRIRPLRGRLLWFIDRSAGQALNRGERAAF